jgi:aerobic-type carbon monoxide dehydrogenase small subunit (CoxS/CutS family)
MADDMRFKLNGKPVRLAAGGSETLLWALRTELALTGTKYGCGEGHCGACTVLVNGEAVRSCQLQVAEVNGKEVTTIEGLAQDGKLHPVQHAFMEHDAFQCGFCTSGMIMKAVGFLTKKPNPSEAEIVSGMESNLCRCGAHCRILSAVGTAAKQMREVRR